MANLDSIFNASCGRFGAPVSELAAPDDMALPSSKHLKVMESGGWIESEKAGRVRTCRLKPETAKAAEG
jgi:hypothetical protein